MAPLLGVDALALQLETLELAQSIFPLPGEVVLQDRVEAALPSLRAWIEAGGKGDRSAVATDELSFTVTLSLEPASTGPSSSSSTPPFPLVLAVRIPLTPPVDASATLPDGTSAATVHLQQPAWLSRTAHDALAASLPSTNPRAFLSNIDLILDTIDQVRTQVIAFLPDPAALAAAEQARANGGGGGGGGGSGAGKRRRAPVRADVDEDEFRVWLWFPSLSTREKRDNIVDWAGEYGITGFVLAGASRRSSFFSFSFCSLRLARTSTDSFVSCCAQASPPSCASRGPSGWCRSSSATSRPTHGCAPLPPFFSLTLST